MSELLPCPFCGGTEIIAYGPREALGAWVACVMCGLETPTETGVEAEQAVDYWNSRPGASSQAEIERLRKALEPFADFADYLASETEGFADYDELRLLPDESDFELFRLKVEAFRNARAALTGSKE